MRVAVAAVVIVVLAGGRATAQPVISELTEIVEPAAPTRASYAPVTPISRSYIIPAIEVVVLDILAHLGARAAGVSWAEVTPSTIATNLTHAWVYDEDVFAVNQFAHPYGGSGMFLAARSSGLGFWTSSAYAFAGSLLWETLMESEPPSINDQITTPIAGALLGEALHRWGRAVRMGGGAHPSIGRRVLSALIDPMGTTNRAMFGDRWRKVPPPEVHAHMGAGWNQALVTDDRSPVHLELAVSHGFPSDERFVPRVPLDHFDLRAQLDFGTDDIAGFVNLRGLVVGSVFGPPRRRALWGLYGTYDYWNPDYARASAVGVGPGITAHAAIGARGFAEAVAVLTLVPFGAAGGAGDGGGPQRDYHHGPGLGQLLELKLGLRDVGLLKLGARAIEIDGTLVGDATEAVVVTTLGGLVQVAPHHAIGVELVYAARGARFEATQDTAFDQASQLRVMYAITSDGAFGGGR